VGGAGAYLLFGSAKWIGIFAVLMAAILARVLVINVPEALERRDADEEEQ